MDTRLTTFLTVVRYGGFSAAARHLNITQPAVSQHIRSLEREYGATLIRRKGNRSLPTPEGELLRSFAERIRSIYHDLDRRLASGIVRTYDIGATLTVAEYLLAEILGEYRRHRPSCRVRLSVQNTERTIASLERGDLDFAIVEGPLRGHTLPSRDLTEDLLIAVCAPDDPLLKRMVNGKVPLASLLEADLILREPGSGTRAVFEHYLLVRGEGHALPEPFMEIGSINVIKSLVLSGLGITVVSERAVRRELAAGALVRVPLAGPPIRRRLRMLWTADSNMEFVDDFGEFCRASVDRVSL